VTLHTTTGGLERAEVVTRRVTTPARSIAASAAGTAPEQVEMGARQALERGLATRRSLLAQANRRGGRAARLIGRAVREARRS